MISPKCMDVCVCVWGNSLSLIIYLMFLMFIKLDASFVKWRKLLKIRVLHKRFIAFTLLNATKFAVFMLFSKLAL